MWSLACQRVADRAWQPGRGAPAPGLAIELTWMRLANAATRSMTMSRWRSRVRFQPTRRRAADGRHCRGGTQARSVLGRTGALGHGVKLVERSSVCLTSLDSSSGGRSSAAQRSEEPRCACSCAKRACRRLRIDQPCTHAVPCYSSCASAFALVNFVRPGPSRRLRLTLPQSTDFQPNHIGLSSDALAALRMSCTRSGAPTGVQHTRRLSEKPRP